MEEKREIEIMEDEQEVRVDDASVTESVDEINEILDGVGLEEIKESDEQDTQEQEIKEARERMLRLHADFDNYRKRVQKEKEEWFQYASLSIIEKLLPVLDNFERALDSVNQQGEETKNLYSGIEMIYRQFVEIMEKEGLKPIESLGQMFNPLFHEAIMQVPLEEGHEDNAVVEELRKGYIFKDKVVRPSMVKVAKK